MLKVVWYDTIKNVSKEVWNEIFPDEVLKSQLIFKSMEDSFVGIIKCYYLCVYDNDKVIAILPCFEYRLNLDVVASRKIQSVAKNIRIFWKKFFSVKVFVVGSYIATVEEYIGIKEGLDKEIHKYIVGQVKNKTKELKCKIAMIKEVPDSHKKRVEHIFEDFVFVDSLPNSYVPISKRFRPYPSLLKTKARQRFSRAKRDFIKNELHFELVNNFEDYAKIACELYTNVLNKSNSKFEKLNPAFFENASKNFQGKSYLLLLRDKQDDIKSIELIFECKNKLIPIYIGIDYTYHDVKTLYFNTIIHSIELAEEKKLDYVVLGQNNYFPKALSGAIIERGYLGFYSHKKMYSFIIHRLFHHLFPPFKNDAGVFYDEKAKTELLDFCAKYNINMLPDERVEVSKKERYN